MSSSQLEKLVDAGDYLYSKYGDEKFSSSELKKVIGMIAGTSTSTWKQYKDLNDEYRVLEKVDYPYFRVDKERLDKLAGQLGCSRDYLHED